MRSASIRSCRTASRSWEANAIVSNSLLDPAYTWEPDDALKVTIDALSHEDMMRLWDLLEPTYRLSVPYLVRTVKLTPVEQPAVPPVLTRVNVFTQAGLGP